MSAPTLADPWPKRHKVGNLFAAARRFRQLPPDASIETRVEALFRLALAARRIGRRGRTARGTLLCHFWFDEVYRTAGRWGWDREAKAGAGRRATMDLIFLGLELLREAERFQARRDRLLELAPQPEAEADA
jgi:hypothetical protein